MSSLVCWSHSEDSQYQLLSQTADTSGFSLSDVSAQSLRLGWTLWATCAAATLDQMCWSKPKGDCKYGTSRPDSYCFLCLVLLKQLWPTGAWWRDLWGVVWCLTWDAGTGSFGSRAFWCIQQMLDQIGIWRGTWRLGQCRVLVYIFGAFPASSVVRQDARC